VSSQPRLALGRTSEQSRIRCLVAHDHVLLRQGVRRLLEDEPDLEVIGEACTVSELLHKVASHRPDVVLLDAGMRGGSTSEATRLIKRDYPGVRLIFLGTSPLEESGGGMQLNPHGYLPKDTPAPQLIKLVRGNQAGHTGMPVSAQTSATSGQLTAREQEVLRLVAEGNTARKVAALLGLSVKTVEAHKFNFMRKLNIHNKAQLVAYAIQNNLLRMPVRN
jgi:two-component system, NarL family, response regulator NreC